MLEIDANSEKIETGFSRREKRFSLFPLNRVIIWDPLRRD